MNFKMGTKVNPERLLKNPLPIEFNLKPSNGLSFSPCNESLPMSQGEEKEAHLIEALQIPVVAERKNSIPIPEVTDIDDESYNRMYPENFIVPKKRIITFPDDDVVDYDMDSDDQQWLQKQQQVHLKINPINFEKVIEYLENNSISDVPTLDSVIKELAPIYGFEALEEIYDYWLDKRTKHKQKLIFRVKHHEKYKFNSSKTVVEDPYVAFRECVDKMHTRKNRLNDQANYMKMLEIKRGLEKDARMLKSVLITEQTKHDLLYLKSKIFEAQYYNKTFNERFLENSAIVNIQMVFSKNYKIDDNKKDNYQFQELEKEKEEFDFKRLANCDYHKPIDFQVNSFVNKTKCSRKSTSSISSRLGRGGRIIYDRNTRARKSDDEEEAEVYNSIKLIQPKIVLNLTDSEQSEIESQNENFSRSSFTLKNATQDVKKEDNIFEFVFI
ncbi:CLUMA_CG004288, isoform A [Clunio marinus]|uniref:Enhancer of polycomb-like protein n=1 Tax=Clunio marinus TaxID=568069 RepID=A0A1J1HSR7_9DIPT|nr:CLUMA_CG004288, isoform A [Clunio marinus]